MRTVGETLLKVEAEDHAAFMLNFSLNSFKRRFADEARGNGDAFENATELVE